MKVWWWKTAVGMIGVGDVEVVLLVRPWFGTQSGDERNP
jgi:hypothetical protein